MPDNFISIYDRNLCTLYGELYNFIDKTYFKIKNETNQFEKLKLLAEYQEKTKKIKESIKTNDIQRKKINNTSQVSTTQYKYFSGLLGNNDEEIHNKLLTYQTKKDYYKSLDDEIQKISNETVLNYVIGRITKAENVAYYGNTRIIYSLINELHLEISNDNYNDEKKVINIAAYDEIIKNYQKMIFDAQEEYAKLKQLAKEINAQNIDINEIQKIDSMLALTSYGEISNIMNDNNAYNELMEWKEKEKSREEFSAQTKSIIINNVEKEYHKLLEKDAKQLLVYLYEKRVNDDVIKEFKKTMQNAKSNVALLELNRKTIDYIHNHCNANYQLDSSFVYDEESTKKNKPRKVS